MQQNPISRRKFLATSALTASSIVLPQQSHACNPLLPAARANLSGIVKELGKWFGSAMLGGVVYDYLKGVTVNVLKRVDAANEKMKGAGFTDFSQSTVYRVDLDGVFFYLVMSANKVDGCAAFVLDQQGKEAVIAMLEGPTLAALERATADVTNQTGSSNLARELFLPIAKSPALDRNFQKSYSGTDRIMTRAGHCDIHYQKTATYEGFVTVKAYKRNLIKYESQIKVQYG